MTKRILTTVRLAPDLDAWLEVQKTATGLSKNQIIEIALQEYQKKTDDEADREDELISRIKRLMDKLERVENEEIQQK